MGALCSLQKRSHCGAGNAKAPERRLTPHLSGPRGTSPRSPAEVSGKPTAQARGSPSGTERALRRSLIPDPRGGLRLPARSPALDSTESPRHRARAIMDGEGRRGETRGLPGTQPMLASGAQRGRRQGTRPLLLSPTASAGRRQQPHLHPGQIHGSARIPGQVRISREVPGREGSWAGTSPTERLS